MSNLDLAENIIVNAGRIAGISKYHIQRIQHPSFFSEHTFQFDIEGGGLGIAKAYIAFHTLLPKVSKVTLRITSNSSPEDAKALAIQSSILYSLNNLPINGGAAILDLQRNDLSLQSVKNCISQFVIELKKISSNSVIIELEESIPRVVRKFFTTELFATTNFNLIHNDLRKVESNNARKFDASISDAFCIASKIIESYKLAGNRLTCAVAGDGSEALMIANFVSECRIGEVVALSDNKTTVFHELGLPIEKISQYFVQTSSINLSGLGRNSHPDTVISYPCDILFLCSKKARLGQEFAEEIRAKFVFEISEGILSSRAESRLIDNHKVVIPDILFEGARLARSYFSNLYAGFSDFIPDSVNLAVESTIQEVLIEINKVCTEYGLSIREGAYVTSIIKLSEQMV